MVLKYFGIFYEFLLLSVVLLNIYQRKIPHTENKRRAPLLWAIDLLVVYFLLVLRSSKGFPEWIDYLLIALGLGVAIVMHKQFWPFRLHCTACGKKLGFEQIIGYDENFCTDCFKETFPEKARKIEEKTKKPSDLESLENAYVNANTVDEVPWKSWEPTERCVLTYLFDGDKVLLIEKKRGMGSGYHNAPGGHIELEETKLEAAIRETKEETGLDISDIKEVGTLYFQFKEGIRMIGYVFFAYSYKGELIDECDETKPFWCDIDKLDYSMMWEDDRLWLPLALEGKKFEGYFVFDDRTMLDHKIVVEEDD